jgi:hypothetical protein
VLAALLGRKQPLSHNPRTPSTIKARSLDTKVPLESVQSVA